MPHFLYESECPVNLVCGVDEAGRGPWAGPVVASAVVFYDRSACPKGLNDSKKLTQARRSALYLELTDKPNAIATGVGLASAEEIDHLNIWQATALAMRRAVEALPQLPQFALIDGKLHPTPFPCPTRAIIGGDGMSLSIAAASIIAKVTRDQLMTDYAQQYPHYGFDRHAGYGTAAHQEALARHGPCPIHRRSFKPIRALEAA